MKCSAREHTESRAPHRSRPRRYTLAGFVSFRFRFRFVSRSRNEILVRVHAAEKRGRATGGPDTQYIRFPTGRGAAGPGESRSGSCCRLQLHENTRGRERERVSESEAKRREEKWNEGSCDYSTESTLKVRVGTSIRTVGLCRCT